MKTSFFSGVLLTLILFSVSSSMLTTSAQVGSTQQLAGLWEAKQCFGPDVRGSLLIQKTGDEWRAEIAGRVARVATKGDSVSFELPDGKGKFQGKFVAAQTRIVGHWIQPAISEESGLPYASPVTLVKDKQNVWRGEVSPLQMTLTFYLMIKPRDDDTVGAFLKNPERNLGRFTRIDHIKLEGESVKLFAVDTADKKGAVLAEGKYDAENKTMSIYFPERGRNGTFDFRRVEADEMTDFYPRGRPSVPYIYAPPPQLDDGWQTGTLEEVGISRAAIEKFIQMIIDTPIDSVSSQEDHGILIARHGKLVLEEYFHGENRDKPHDTRSASKSVASDLMGAEIYSGVKVSPSDHVYQIMNGGTFPPDLEPRKRALTVENLLTMSSGFDCDDNDENSPGFEDNMWAQTEQPDYYKWTLALKTIRQPGEKAVYCSANANLTGGVVSRVANNRAQVLFQKLLAEPLQIKLYYLPLSPAGDYTMTGSARFLPRDFMKLGQLHLSGGVWNGRRVFTEKWSQKATSPLYYLDAYKLKYGYLWWVIEYPYKGKTISAYFASGNGGQVVMAVPELDMVLAFYGGNYSDVGGRTARNVYVPQYILPAVEN